MSPETLNKEDQDILDSIENGTIIGSGISDAEKKNLAKIANNTLLQNR